MSTRFFSAVLGVALFLTAFASAETPLRVFIRSGAKSHGPGAHDHPAFLKDWVVLLNERGAKATGADRAPTREELDATDVLVIHRDGGGDFSPEEKEQLNAFTKRGGGIVVIHAGSVSNTQEGTDYFKQLIGGSWRRGTTKWLEGPMNLYFTDRFNPITKDCSNFEMDDEIYYDMDVLPEVHVLAGAYTPKPVARDERSIKKSEELTKGGKQVSVYDIQPQIWTYSKDNYRAFVSILGHYYKNFDRANFRTILLRGIAWAGKRANTDELCRANELGDHLRYVDGGPTRPEKAAEKLEIHPDFNLSLVASEPLVNKVLNVDWDPQGRLWVCETPEYPNGRRNQNTDPWKDAGSLYPGSFEREPQDKISWLEDTDGDGRMDKKHVFADHLELVTSFVFHKNGVIACAAPNIWLLEDTQGKGICDKRTILYTGLGDRDTHAVINNMRWGQDGWIYATNGYSTSPKVTNADGSKEFGGYSAGVIRFKADGSAFEQYSSKSSNTWGLCMTSDGQCFYTQPTCGEVLMHVALPENILAKGKILGTNSYNVLIKGQHTFPLMKWEQQAYVQIDQVGFYTAAAGCAIYEGGAWPAPWNYSYFTTEPTINIVSHFNVSRNGASYSAAREKGREETEFIRSKDLWFRPVETRVGPDGALYVVDFYNQAVIHNDTRGPAHGPANAAVRPDRDHYFSRIWKVQHKQAKPVEIPKLDPKNREQLLQVVQNHSNAQTKISALRLLRENYSDEQVAKALQRPSGPAALSAYEDAIQSAGSDSGRSQLLRKFIAASDPWTKSAIVAASTEYPLEVIAAALSANAPAELSDLVQALVEAALKKGTDSAQKLVLLADRASSQNMALKNVILKGLSNSPNNLGSADQQGLEALRHLLKTPETAGAALSLTPRLDKSQILASAVKEEVQRRTTVLNDATAAIDSRIVAAHVLSAAVAADPSALTALSQALLSDSSEPLKRGLLIALGNRSEQACGDLLVRAFAQLSTALRSEAFNQILRRPEWTQNLLKTLPNGAIKTDDLGPANIARLRTHPDKVTAKLAASILDSVGNRTDSKKDNIITALTPEVEKAGGDIEKGKALFTSACATCHKLGTLGAEVGPSLEGMGAHSAADLLVAIVDPNREVDPSFVAWNISKKNGESLAGVIAQENATSLQLRSPAGTVEIAKDQIQSRENTHRSLMPEGFEAFGPDNLRNLLAFIRSTETRFRILNLGSAFTADTRGGLFSNQQNKTDTIAFNKFGTVPSHGIPFQIVDASKSPSGRNVVVLKGGKSDSAFSKTLPKGVMVPVDANIQAIHLLSGVGGWAGGGFQPKGTVVMTVSVSFENGETEEFPLKDGEHFADYNGRGQVTGSQEAEGLVSRGQIRIITLHLKKPGVVKSLKIESTDSVAAPVVAAITASLGGSKH